MATTRSEPSTHHRVAALDGLRGVAVLMVVLSHVSSYHAELLGPAGVAIFFALSGYLITTLLLKERDRWGGVSLPAFYLRRALRLFPALLLVIVLTPLLLWSAADHRLGHAAGGLAATLFYVQDFDSATGHVSVLPHAWSLAVEEQFYLIWPLTLGLIVWRAGGDRRRISRIVLLTCAVAAVWHLVSIGLLSYDWTYYAPDSNAVFLLTGCALATSLRSSRRLMVPGWAANGTLAAVIVLPLVLTRLPVDQWRLSTALMFPVSLAGVVLVLGAPKLPVLNLGVLRWFGKISYGLYLWNYVLISLEPHGHLLSGRERLLAAIAAIGMAAASWYLIESPILRYKKRFQRVPDQLSPPLDAATGPQHRPTTIEDDGRPARVADGRGVELRPARLSARRSTGQDDGVERGCGRAVE